MNLREEFWEGFHGGLKHWAGFLGFAAPPLLVMAFLFLCLLIVVGRMK